MISRGGRRGKKRGGPQRKSFSPPRYRERFRLMRDKKQVPLKINV